MKNDLLHFAVGFHGQRFHIRLVERHWLFWTRSVSAEVGFYTTRFVLAVDANDAIRTASEILRNDIEERFPDSPDGEFEVYEVKTCDHEYCGAGSGYSFYGKDENAEFTIRQI